MADSSTPAAGTVEYDELTQQIADYVCDYQVDSDSARQTAFLSLVDGLGCAIKALTYPECVRVIQPFWADTTCTVGARVPGTA